MFDPDKVLSWTKREFDALIRGVEERKIDEYEFEAWRAMAHRYAQSAKRPSQKKIFNAKAVRNKMQSGFTHSEDEIKEMVRLSKAAQGFNPMAHFKTKGGST